MNNKDQQPFANFNSYRVEERVIDEMIGLCRGITADGVINYQEADFLVQWMKTNLPNSDNVIIQQLYRRIKEMLADSVLDQQEQAELLDLLRMFTGDKSPGEVVEQLSSDLPLNDPPPKVVFADKYFCLTGKFAYGPRKICSKIITDHRGHIKPKVTGLVDYLVIGFFASSDWIHSSYGRKIETAVYQREQERAKPLYIISEDIWSKYAFQQSDNK